MGHVVLGIKVSVVEAAVVLVQELIDGVSLLFQQRNVSLKLFVQSFSTEGVL